MAGEKILIIDDEKAINDLVVSYLQKEGFSPLSAYTGKEALEVLEKEKPDFVVLDIMLPDIDGNALCLEIRKKSEVGILFLSCREEEMDKIIALSAGGDDYMTKPFMPGELVARIKAHLRRHQTLGLHKGKGEEVYTYPGLTVNVTTREVVVEGEDVSLTAKEFDLLLLFVQNPRRVFSAEQLFELAWQTSSLAGDSRTVMVYISTLRKKIEPGPDSPKYILNIRGVGYKFNHQLLREEGGENHG
jgi:DNA-binding response OmpR family regulator